VHDTIYYILYTIYYIRSFILTFLDSFFGVIMVNECVRRPPGMNE
jgi:hypothetical protein